MDLYACFQQIDCLHADVESINFGHAVCLSGDMAAAGDMAYWMTIALLSRSFGDSFPRVTSSRGTGIHQGVMALVLFAGYLVLIIRNLKNAEGEGIDILRLLLIGIGVQLAWEAVLTGTQKKEAA
jgi:hypothetical protein